MLEIVHSTCSVFNILCDVVGGGGFRVGSKILEQNLPSCEPPKKKAKNKPPWQPYLNTLCHVPFCV